MIVAVLSASWEVAEFFRVRPSHCLRSVHKCEDHVHWKRQRLVLRWLLAIFEKRAPPTNGDVRRKKKKLKLLSSRTSSTQIQDISIRVVDWTRTATKCTKIEWTCKACKLLFFNVKYANLCVTVVEVVASRSLYYVNLERSWKTKKVKKARLDLH